MKRIGLNRYKSAALFAGVILFTGLAWSTDLRTDFMDPPSSAHPKVLWKWMNGNVSPEGITTDLEAMKRTGVGGRWEGRNRRVQTSRWKPAERLLRRHRSRYGPNKRSV